jgi:3-oxoadipate enol-lactonase
MPTMHAWNQAAAHCSLGATPPASYAAYCLAILDNDPRGALGTIRVPILIISGSEDVPTPRTDALPARADRRRVLRRAGRGQPSIQRLPDAFAPLVRQFLLTP